jgi:hypothetical protein
MRQKYWPNPTRLLEPDASAALRDRLIGEVNEIASDEQAAVWGLQALAAKKTLLTADAERVENAFRVRLTKLTSKAAADPSERPRGHHGEGRRRRTVIDKTVLRLPTTRRIRNREQNQLPNKRVWSAAAVPPMRDLRSHRRLAAKSATNSRCHCAVASPRSASLRRRGGVVG